MDGRIRLLVRCYYARAALAQDSAPDDAQCDALEKFRKSLPVVPARRLLLGFVVLVLSAAFLIGASLSVLVPSITPHLVETREFHLRSSASDLGKAAVALTPVLTKAWKDTISSLDASAGWSSLTEQVLRDWLTALTFASILMLAVYILLVCPASAYRLKRTLFNVSPNAGQRLAATVGLYHRRRVDGVYYLETQLFRRLGLRPPREIPFDLVVQALLVLLVVTLLAVTAPRLDDQSGMSRFEAYLLGLILLVPAARAGWLIAIERRRHRESVRGLAPPRECPGCGDTFRVESIVCPYCRHNLETRRIQKVNLNAQLCLVFASLGLALTIWLPFNILSLVFAYRAKKDISRSGGAEVGWERAAWGVALSLVVPFVFLFAVMLNFATRAL
jgi:predicted nucleic acid-binding Zn ribbon protein